MPKNSGGGSRNSGGNRNNPKVETRQRVTVSSNSNNPNSRTTTTSNIKLASGTPENVGRLRVGDRPAGNWANAQYGNAFGKGDIGRLQEKGFSNNQIMKIAQMAYGQGEVKGTNKVNEALYGLSSGLLNPPQVSTWRQGQETTTPYYGLNAAKLPSKVLGWQGFGSGMSVNRRGGSGIGSYKQTSVWNMPSNLTEQGGFKPYSMPAKGFDTTTTPSPADTSSAVGTGDTTTTEASPIGPEDAVKTPTSDYGDMYSLTGAPKWSQSRKGKKRGISSTRAAGQSSKKMASSQTLGI